MDSRSSPSPPPTTLFLILSSLIISSFKACSSDTTFTIVNHCSYTVWPGVLSGAGSPPLSTTGFPLPSGTSQAISAPTGWSGRFWARTGCNFSPSGAGTTGSCATADCGTDTVECSGHGADPPATLAEFTLTGPNADQDFYDVSLVDGYNLPMAVSPHGGSGGNCAVTGCVSDLNRVCPPELRAAGGAACRSACEAFRSPEYCCSGAYGSPATCPPTNYSAIFKSACPKAYSYAYDDATSTFTCSGAAGYTIAFCLGGGEDSPPSSTMAQFFWYDLPESERGMILSAGGGESWLATLSWAEKSAAPAMSAPAFHELVVVLLQALAASACILLLGFL